MPKFLRYLTLLALLFGWLGATVHAQEGTRAEQAVAFLAANQIPPDAYDDMAAALSTNDHRNVAAVLAQAGYSPEQLRAFITDMNLLLLSNAIQPQPSDVFQVQALALLQSYGLNGRDLQDLAPLANDPPAILAALRARGLSAEQATALLGELGAVLQVAADQGLMPYYVVNAHSFALVTGAGLPRAALYDSAHLLDDPAAVAARLTGLGFTEEQAQTFVDLLPDLAAMGVTPDAIEGWTVRSLIYRLEGIGLAPGMIYEVVALDGADAMRSYLAAHGLSGDVLELALVQVGDCMGYQGEALDPARLRAFQAREVRTLLDRAGIPDAEMGVILALYSHPAVLRDYLAAAAGLDDAQIATFVTALGQSTFARTLAPEDADAYLDREAL